jgi:type VI protein secretion system component VasA
MQYIDRELGQLVSIAATQDAHVSANQGHLIDRLQSIDFLSIIEFVSGKPKISTARALTIELAYDQKLISRKTNVRFGEILRYSLCKEAPLRASVRAKDPRLPGGPSPAVGSDSWKNEKIRRAFG